MTLKYSYDLVRNCIRRMKTLAAAVSRCTLEIQPRRVSGICLNWRGISGVPPSFWNRLIIFAKDARCVGQRTRVSAQARQDDCAGDHGLLVAEYTSPSRWQN